MRAITLATRFASFLFDFVIDTRGPCRFPLGRFWCASLLACDFHPTDDDRFRVERKPKALESRVRGFVYACLKDAYFAHDDPRNRVEIPPPEAGAFGSISFTMKAYRCVVQTGSKKLRV